MAGVPMKRYALVLGLLAATFFVRVIGQLAVSLFEPSFLPPMERWYSGLLQYPALLLSQILILCFQAMVSMQLWRGKGTLTHPRPALGRALKWFSLVYFLAMAVRYGISASIDPEGHLVIPILFHFILALYIYLLSRYWRSLPPPGSSLVRVAQNEDSE